MRFLMEGRFEQTMVLHLCGSGKYTTVLCFSIIGDDIRIPAPSCNWGVDGFLERPLMCWVNTGLGCVFAMLRVKISDLKKKIPLHYIYKLSKLIIKIGQKEQRNILFFKTFSLMVFKSNIFFQAENQITLWFLNKHYYTNTNFSTKKFNLKSS